jgi:PPOX class probable F420-dependent enzyme
LDDDEARRRMAAARVVRLATVDSDGRPHLVPCCIALAGRTLWSAVDGKPKSTPALRRLENIRRRPWASVLADHYDDDWSRLWWVRADGAARVVDAGDATDGAAALAAKYAQYRETPPDGPFVAVDITRWRAWAAADFG